MNDESTMAPNSVRDDLAFLRDLAERGQRGSIAGGSVFVAGGVLYGVQCLFHWAQLRGWIDPPDVVGLVFVVGITATFMAVLTWVIWRDRKAGSTGLMSRALNAVFGGIGLANLAMVIVFGFNAASANDFSIWLFYPPVIFALQGAAWYTAAVLRKRAWQGLVAAGWLIAATALGLVRHSIEAYLLITTLSLFLLMALPGLVLIRLAKKDA